jgi:hypothetical protein
MCFETDVSELPIGPTSKDRAVQADPWGHDRYVVPKRRFQTTSRRIITQETEEFSLTAANAYDHV